MYCPSCKDEFRPGFTRCAACEVDLVEDLRQVPSEAPSPAAGPRAPLVDYCGFLGLDEAQQARRQLGVEGIANEIVIRDAAEPGRDEHWLRVDPRQLARVRSLIGFEELDAAPDAPGAGAGQPAGADGDFQCGDCGHAVADEDVACPGCGARFDDE